MVVIFSFLGFYTTFLFAFSQLVVDTNAPVVICPDDIYLTIKIGEVGHTVEFAEPTVVDDSGVANQVSASHSSGDFFLLGETIVTYQFADNSGNVGSCSFIISITDGKQEKIY